MQIDASLIINAILGLCIIIAGGIAVSSFKRASQQSEDIAVLKATMATKESVSGLEEKTRSHGYEIAEMKKTVGVVSEMKGELSQIKERVDLIYEHIMQHRGGEVT